MDAWSQPALAAALDFTGTDLAANRAGQLSDRQRAGLSRSRTIGRAGTVVVGLIAMAFIIVIAVTFVPRLSADKTPGSGSVVDYVIGALALIAVVVTISMINTRRALNRLVPTQVSRVEGIVTVRARQLPGNVGDAPGGPAYGGGIRYEVTIGDARFLVPSQAALGAFSDGQIYRGYYVGRGVMATLLSAEPREQ